jgi:signal transduction histidine kinase
VSIIDDGRGFNVENIMSGSNRKGLGLSSIQERVRLINGAVEIRSKIGDGTTIFLELKL